MQVIVSGLLAGWAVRTFPASFILLRLSMKTAILRIALLLILGITALASRAQTAPDTLAEQKLIRVVGADICRQLEAEDKKTPLSRLTKEEAQQLFVRLTMLSAANNPEFMALLTSGDGANEARLKGEDFGRKVAMWLLGECAISQALFMRMGAEQAQTSQSTPLRPEEAKALRPVADAICRDLQPRVAMIKKLSSAERMQVVTQSFEKHLKTHAAQISKVFGADVFQDEVRMRDMGTKVGIQMASECPDAVLLFADFTESTSK